MALSFHNRLADLARPNASFVNLLTAVLRPLLRMSLRHEFGVREFCELARWIAVDIALHDPEFATKGRDKHAQTRSHAAVITGLTRREVVRLANAPKPEVQAQRVQHHRLARVLSGWLEDSYFRDEQGKSLDLPLRAAEGPTFTELVRRYANDVPPRAIMDRLLVSGNVRLGCGKRIQFVDVILGCSFGGEPDFDISAMAAENLLTTMDALNSNSSECLPRFRDVYYRSIPKSQLPVFREFVNQHIHKLAVWFNTELRTFDDPDSNEETVTAGVGLYSYFRI